MMSVPLSSSVDVPHTSTTTRMSFLKLSVTCEQDHGETSNSSICRAYLAIDTLRDNKWAAGSWALLTRLDDGGESPELNKTASVVAQLWPSITLNPEAIQLSPAHSKTLRQAISITLTPLDVAKQVTKVAKTIYLTLEATSVASVTKKVKKDEVDEERETGWLEAVVREQLMDQKYLLPQLVVQLPSSKTPNPEYRIKDIVASTKVSAGVAKLPSRTGSDVSSVIEAGTQALSDKLKGLNLAQQQESPEILLMNWKTEIVFVDGKQAGQEHTPGQNGETGKVLADKTKRTRKLDSNSALPSYINIFSPTPPAKSRNTNADASVPSDESSLSAYSTLGGLNKQISQVRSLLDLPLSQPSIYTRFGLKPPRGILLYGPPGTGKTHLARAIASSTSGCSCIVVNGPELSSAYHGETEERVRAVFEEARRREPCIIVLDEVDAICPKREGGEGGEVERRVTATLLTLMDGMSEGVVRDQQERHGDDEDDNELPNALARVVVIAATNRPNTIDPALRRPGRFDREIEIGIPDADARYDILTILISKIPHTIELTDLRAVADRTHGYVGADLSALVREAGSGAIHRWLAGRGQPQSTGEPCMVISDLILALPSIRPSAMREIFLEPPKTPWSSIGGQEHIKQKLKECVEWPITRKHVFKRLGVEAPRGVLLYGPPGCSKTLMAKALATESGVNFMAVKGPELLNKYVGESEKAVREIFRKARAAAPSIIFFDEIDSLGLSRGGSGSSVGDGVLTSLLNEMDGIESLSGVIVVAATNRPDSLDPALLRPGRLDRILYVGPPDRQSRKRIFEIRLGKMRVDPDIDVELLAELTDGCSGAEIVSICQDAALAAINSHAHRTGHDKDDGPQHISSDHFIAAAKAMRRGITTEMLETFGRWSAGRSDS